MIKAIAVRQAAAAANVQVDNVWGEEHEDVVQFFREVADDVYYEYTEEAGSPPPKGEAWGPWLWHECKIVAQRWTTEQVLLVVAFGHLWEYPEPPEAAIRQEPMPDLYDLVAIARRRLAYAAYTVASALFDEHGLKGPEHEWR